MARKTKEEAEKTRALILETALRLFFEKGYSGSTLVDIAKEIDLTKGAIYWHFKSKVDLFLELGKSMEEKIGKELAAFFYHSGGLDNIREFAVRMVQCIARDPELNMYYNLVYYGMEWQEELLPVKEFFIKQDEELTQYTVDLFKQAQKKGEVSKEFSVTSVAAGYQAIVDGFLSRVLLRDADSEQLIADLEFSITTYFRGLEQ